MSGPTTLDLSTLPPPDAVEEWSFDAIQAQSLATFLEYWTAARAKDPTLPAYDIAKLRANPVHFILAAGAWREGLLRQRMNEAVRAVMVASAAGADLEQLAALVGVARRTITPADAQTSTPAVMESYEELRARVPLALDATAVGYVRGGYRTTILANFPAVEAVGVIKGAAGRITLVLQGRGADGTVDADTVAAVTKMILAEDQLTDIVSVRSCAPRNYRIVAHARVPKGPAIAPARAASQSALATMAAAMQAIGRAVPIDAIIAAGRVPPMIKFEVIEPAEDVIAGDAELPVCTSISVTVEAVDA